LLSLSCEDLEETLSIILFDLSDCDMLSNIAYDLHNILSIWEIIYMICMLFNYSYDLCDTGMLFDMCFMWYIIQHLKWFQLICIATRDAPSWFELVTLLLQEIPPFETKSIMKASFIGRQENNHTAFIRIRTNRENPDERLILPVEVEVTSGKEELLCALCVSLIVYLLCVT